MPSTTATHLVIDMTLSTRQSDTVSGFTLVTPAVALYLLFVLVPAVAVIVLSFFEWNFFNTPSFVGLANFQRVVTDPALWQAAGVTLGFLVMGVMPTLIVGFVFAVLVNAEIPAIGALRALYFVPVVVSVSVSAVLWGFLYDPRQGPIGSIARAAGLQAPNFLGSPSLALPSVTLVMIWGALPIVIVFYLAALQRIPADIYSAAALDGASRWRTIWVITWPNVTGTTALLAVLQIANFSASSLDYALVLTRGGPLAATRSLGLYAYEAAFAHQEVGYASAISIVQILLILTLLVGGYRLSRRLAR